MKLIHWIFEKLLPGDAALALRLAGLDEARLRRMDPDDRVAALEKAGLDPYDYIYLSL